MKGIRKALLIFVAVVAVLFLARNFIVKTVVEAGVGTVTGFPLKIGSLNLGVGNSLVDIKDLKLKNPSKYPDDLMVDIPEIYVDYDLGSFLTGGAHLNEIRFDLAEVVIVKNKDGEVNINELKSLQSQKDSAKKKKEAPADKKKVDVQIDSVSLKVGKVVFKDYSKGDEPKVKEYAINLNENYENIENLNAVITLIAFKTITKAGIAGIVGFDLAAIEGALGSSIGMATDAIEGVGTAASEGVDKAKEAADAAGDTLKETGENLKGLIKNPFGDDK